MNSGKKYGKLTALVLLLLMAMVARTQVDSLLQIARQPPNDTAGIDAYYTLAKMHVRADPPRALIFAHQMRAAAMERGNFRRAALAERTLGTLHWLAERYDSSLHYQQRALATLGDPANDPVVGVGILTNIANHHIIEEDYDEAVKYLADAYELAEASGYDRDAPKILNNLGALYWRLGRKRAARRAYEAAMERKVKDRDTLGMAASLANLGKVMVELGEIDAGMAQLERAKEFYALAGRPEEVPTVDVHLGIAYYVLDQYGRATRILEDALANEDMVLEERSRADVMLALAEMYRQEGQPERALDYLHAGYESASGIENIRANYDRAFGRVYTMLGQESEATAHFTNFAATIDTVIQRQRLVTQSETAERFQAELREAQIEKQRLIIDQQRQRQTLLYLAIGALALFAVGSWYLLRARLRYQRSEAARREAERKAEMQALKQEAELRSLQSMIAGQEAERKRVAKDLHDGLGGLLATTKATLNAEASTSPAANQLIDRACTEVRRIAHNMMPRTLALSGLSGSVHDTVAQLKQRGLDCELEIVGQPDLRLDEAQQAMILRILQELTHNVVKHAEASKLFIQILDQPNQLLLTVEDDGKGFDPERQRAAGGGIGLANIDSRVAFLKGDIQYDSSPGHGTTITLTIPL